ncbi:hypothetical protein AMJ44_08065 [candidate division WOR-1 bacterium DG_54_3]|uniref:N-acetyltransferase domain-containing protein n=1 Tax=candidate division WOR-1 bacterium DG_54_3 TaxID=1703775 RepID=A0A0S7XW72_UNCSA|nr:MAG: hypothetical protein AMJ44_08065 [candidate division WOR-1 bacterium DG_54_3]
MIEIKTMEHSDIKFAKSLTDIEQWGHLESDFRRLLHLDPQGCFIAWKGNNRVGIATTVSYGDYAFLGNIIVKKEHRGGIIGPRLIQHAVGYLDEKGIKTIELDGVFSAVAMYRYMGFRDKYRSLRLFHKPDGCFDSEKSISYAAPVRDLISFDHKQTGIQRSRMLHGLIQEFPTHTFCVKEERLQAYAIVRERATHALAIGPLVAEELTVCDVLLSTILATFKSEFMTIGVPEINTAAVEMMLQKGFGCSSPSMRMYRGSRIDYERHVYGIISADVG